MIVFGSLSFTILLGLLATQGDRLWLTHLASQFLPHLGLALTASAAIGFAFRLTRRIAAVLAFNALFLGCFLARPIARPALVTEPAPSVRVISANLWLENSEPNAAIGFLEEECLSVSPTYCFLWEVNEAWAERLRESRLAPFLSHLQVRSDPFGAALVVNDRGAVRIKAFHLSPGGIPSIEVRASLEGRGFRLIGAHVMPPVSIGAFHVQRLHLRQLEKKIRSEKTPTLLIGDLNLSTGSPALRNFAESSGLSPSSVGLSPTWYGLGSLLALVLDHALSSENLRVRKFRVGPDVGSDHRPVLVEADLP